jgi:hypothetical protein
MIKYEDIEDKYRGQFDKASGCYLGIIYKYRFRIQRPKSKRKADLNNLMEDVYYCISKLSPKQAFEADRQKIAFKVGCSDPDILKLIGYEIMNPSLIKKYSNNR